MIIVQICISIVACSYILMSVEYVIMLQQYSAHFHLHCKSIDFTCTRKNQLSIYKPRNSANKYTQCNAPIFSGHVNTYLAGTMSGMEGLLAEMYTSRKSNCRSAASTCTQ